MKQAALQNDLCKLSITKNKFAFSKARRFHQDGPRILNHAIGYDIKGDFEKIARNTGSGATFGGSSLRFEYSLR